MKVKGGRKMFSENTFFLINKYEGQNLEVFQVDHACGDVELVADGEVPDSSSHTGG